jgi:hypothetical protein
MSNFKWRLIPIAIGVAGLLATSAQPALAWDQVEVLATVPAQGTVEIKYSSGRVEVSTPLWSGNVPSRVRAVVADRWATCHELTFPIQALRPYAEIVNASSSIEIDFELWTASGQKIDTEWVYSSTWNPLGGQTMIAWRACDVWNKPGSYNLIVRTEQTLSTTGLLSRYVSGMQVVPLVVEPPTNKASTVECKKGKQTKTFKRAKCPVGWKSSS